MMSSMIILRFFIQLNHFDELAKTCLVLVTHSRTTMNETKAKLEEYVSEIEKLKQTEKELKAQIAEQLVDSQQKDKELQELREKVNAIAASPNSVQKIEHSSDFWTSLRGGCVKKTGPFGTDSIKTMIKTGKMTVHDTDPSQFGGTLLIIAARWGAYDLAQFLINNVS